MAYGFNYNFNYGLVNVFGLIIFYFHSVFCHILIWRVLILVPRLRNLFYIYFCVSQGPTGKTWSTQIEYLRESLIERLFTNVWVEYRETTEGNAVTQG